MAPGRFPNKEEPKLHMENPRHRPVLRLVITGVFLAGTGCAGGTHRHEHTAAQGEPTEAEESTGQNQRISLGLDPDTRRHHQAIMQDHLETVQEIVAALAKKNFEEAQSIAESRLGFAKHRDAMQHQRPENFPPVYHDLTRQHHQAAEQLAAAMPSRNLDRILPQLESTLRACVRCHNVYTH